MYRIDNDWLESVGLRGLDSGHRDEWLGAVEACLTALLMSLTIQSLSPEQRVEFDRRSEAAQTDADDQAVVSWLSEVSPHIDELASETYGLVTEWVTEYVEVEHVGGGTPTPSGLVRGFGEHFFGPGAEEQA